MTTLFAQMKSAAQKRAAYNTTVREIENMPLDVAMDLGIFKDDAHEIAYQAVYGR